MQCTNEGIPGAEVPAFPGIAWLAIPFGGGRSSPTAGPALFAAATPGKVRPPRGGTAAVRLPQCGEQRAARGHRPRCSVHLFPAASPPCKHSATPILWQGRAGIAGTREQGDEQPAGRRHGAQPGTVRGCRLRCRRQAGSMGGLQRLLAPLSDRSDGKVAAGNGK